MSAQVMTDGCIASCFSGRSLPGLHAGEIARVHAFLTGRVDISGIELAVVEDHIDVAFVHALLASTGANSSVAAADVAPAKLAIVGGMASLAAPAKARWVTKPNTSTQLPGHHGGWDL